MQLLNQKRLKHVETCSWRRRYTQCARLICRSWFAANISRRRRRRRQSPRSGSDLRSALWRSRFWTDASSFTPATTCAFMGTLGIGVDVVHIPRILALIRRRGPELLARRILSQQEIDEWRVFPPSDVAVQAKFLAVRYAVSASLRSLSTHTQIYIQKMESQRSGI